MVGAGVIKIFVVDEERASSSPVVGPSVGAEVTSEWRIFETGH